MREKGLIAVLLIVGLAGCTSMFTHQKFTDTQVLELADTLAAAESCVYYGFARSEPVADFNMAVKQLLTVSVYNQGLLSDTYTAKKAQFAEFFASRRVEQCKLIAREFPLLTTQINQQYVSIANARNRDIQSLNNSLASMGSTTSSSAYMPPIQSNTMPSLNTHSTTNKTRIYSPDQCSGAIVNGACAGAVIDTGVPRYCYGKVINNVCHGTTSY